MTSLLFSLIFTAIAVSGSYDNPETNIPTTATMMKPCGYFDYLAMEYAQLQFNTSLSTVYIYGISDDCYDCLYLPLSIDNLADTDICVVIDTKHPFSIGYSQEQPFNGCINPPFNKSNDNTCPWEPATWIFQPKSFHYDEYQHYLIQVVPTKVIRKTLKTSSNKYIPLYIALIFIFFIIVSYNIYRLYLKDTCSGGTDESELDISYDDNNNNNNGKKKKWKRFISLDAFRGMSLIIMIFVNYGGGGYWWLSHSRWNGLTVADLVFPWFIFIMGSAMAIVFPRKLKKIQQQQQEQQEHNQMMLGVNNDTTPRITRFSLFQKVITRGIKLFIIGLFIINEAYDLEHMRIPGVLQYFAISYVINSLIIIFTEPLEDLEERSKPSITNLFIPELTLYWKQWMIALCILFINLMIIFLLPVTMYNEKCPKGYQGPGGIGDKGQHIECTGGAHRYVDGKLFGHNHVYQHSTAYKIYHTGWYDPEGFMGSLSATILTFFGIFTGRILTVYKNHKDRIIRWLMMCLVFGLIAGSLCGFKQNGGTIPVNKNLWSLSFICCQASTGIFVLVIFYILIDVRNIWSGLPFHWLGSNSIIIYSGSEIFGHYFPWGFEYGNTDHYKLLLSNVIGVSMWILIAGYLFHKKIFYAL